MPNDFLSFYRPLILVTHKDIQLKSGFSLFNLINSCKICHTCCVVIVYIDIITTAAFFCRLEDHKYIKFQSDLVQTNCPNEKYLKNEIQKGIPHKAHLIWVSTGVHMGQLSWHQWSRQSLGFQAHNPINITKLHISKPVVLHRITLTRTSLSNLIKPISNSNKIQHAVCFIFFQQPPKYKACLSFTKLKRKKICVCVCVSRLLKKKKGFWKGELCTRRFR